MLGKLKNIQELILEEEKAMALIYDMETDLRFMQGREMGKTESLEKIRIAEENARRTEENARNAAENAHKESCRQVVINMLNKTAFSTKKIADLANTSVDHVKEIKRTLSA